MSFSENSSSSSSTPTFQETPENALIDQLSQYASGLAQQMDSWASQEFAKTSAVTDQAVGNFFQAAQKMVGFSNNLTDQYNNITSKDYQQLHDEANSFASPTRMSVDMGQAGATQAQAGDAAIHNSEEALKSFGINPADGRYAGLDKAAAVQNAANVAGAENMQRNADIQTGQRLRSESLQFGAQLPSAIANINNTAIQANAGASNASLANANTGANLKSLADKYLQTAMGIKLPPTGQNSHSQSNGFSSSPQQPHNGGGGNGGGGNGGGGNGLGPNGGINPAWMPQHGGPGSEVIGGRPGGGPKTINGPGDGSGDGFGGPTPGDGSGYDDPNSLTPDFNSGAFGYDDPNSMTPDFNSGSFGYDDPNSMTPSFGAGDSGGFNGGGYDDPNAMTPSFGDYGGGGGGYDDPNAMTPSFSDSGGGGGYDAGNYSSPVDDSSYDMGGAYAGGGAIPDGGIMQSKVAPRAMPPDPRMGPTTGGMVPRQASPSMGQRTDDVPANLNAGEFVIPRDVALWKGQEFFQNLIAQSRQKRVTAPAHGKPAKPGNNPAMQKPPTFSSRPMR